MNASNQYSGLAMPVFSAFGWAGEEKAIEFALSQLEMFIENLYYNLPRKSRSYFVSYGLDNGSQSAYLATNEVPENDIYIAFAARPMNLETSFVVTDKKALAKVYKAARNRPETFYKLLLELGPEWTLRIQQMEYDSEKETSTHFKDLFKNRVDLLKFDTNSATEGEEVPTLTELIEQAAYLNGEDAWVVPMFISRRTSSEKISALGTAVTQTAGDYVASLTPLIQFLTSKTRKPKSKKKVKKEAQPQPAVEETTIRQPSDAADLDKFSYTSELKPLHIRRGFINLTSNHWPFFAMNARTETRPVMINYEDKTDKNCAVWRLVPNDQARIVLSPPVQEWLEDNFEEGDKIQVLAKKLDDDFIHIELNSTE